MSENLPGLGDDEGAVAEAELAVAVRTATLGPDHPITAAASRNLGALYLAQGRLYEALARFDHAYAVWADSVGGAHPRVADLAVQRGLALWAIGQADEAVASLEEGLAGPTKSARGERPWTLRALAALGRVLLAIGRVDEAEPMLRQVLEDARARHGPRDVAYAASLLDMAEVDRARGRAAAGVGGDTRARRVLGGPSAPAAAWHSAGGCSPLRAPARTWEGAGYGWGGREQALPPRNPPQTKTPRTAPGQTAQAETSIFEIGP